MTGLESALLVAAGLVAIANWYAVARQEARMEHHRDPVAAGAMRIVRRTRQVRN